MTATIGGVDADLTRSRSGSRMSRSARFAADAVEASVALDSLLDGRLGADEIRVAGPRVAIDVSPTATATSRGWSAASRSRRSGASRGSGATKLRRVVVSSGSLVAHVAGLGELEADDVELVPDAGGVRVITGRVARARQRRRRPRRARARAERRRGRASARPVRSRVLAVAGTGTVRAPAGAIALHDVAIGRLARRRPARAARVGRRRRRGPTDRRQPRVARARDRPRRARPPLGAFAGVFAARDRASTARTRPDRSRLVRAGSRLPMLQVTARSIACGSSTRCSASSRSRSARACVARSRSRPTRSHDRRARASMSAPRTGRCRAGRVAQPRRGAAWRARRRARTGAVRGSARIAADRAARAARRHGDDRHVRRSRARRDRSRGSARRRRRALDRLANHCGVSAEPPAADPTVLAAPGDQVFADGSHAGSARACRAGSSCRHLPAHVPAAFVAAEDARFYEHHGFDPVQIAKSLEIDLRDRTVARGGSTISQQLVKNTFLTQRRTLDRKLQEAILTWRLEARLDKATILERYLNVIELGPARLRDRRRRALLVRRAGERAHRASGRVPRRADLGAAFDEPPRSPRRRARRRQPHARRRGVARHADRRRDRSRDAGRRTRDADELREASAPRRVACGNTPHMDDREPRTRSTARLRRVRRGHRRLLRRAARDQPRGRGSARADAAAVVGVRVVPAPPVRVLVARRDPLPRDLGRVRARGLAGVAARVARLRARAAPRDPLGPGRGRGAERGCRRDRRGARREGSLPSRRLEDGRQHLLELLRGADLPRAADARRVGPRPAAGSAPSCSRARCSAGRTRTARTRRSWVSARASRASCSVSSPCARGHSAARGPRTESPT